MNQTLFPRSKKGAIDIENGFCKELATHLNVKHEKEVIFCADVPVFKDTEGNDIGHRLPLLECANKMIASMQEHEKMKIMKCRT